MRNKPDDSPSSPSAILNAFVNETIINAARGINKKPNVVMPIPRIKINV